MATVNGFEYVARQKKIAALARHVEELVSFLGLNPQQDGFMIAELVRGWGDQEWNQAGINIGVKPKRGNQPLVGIESRLGVIAYFVERARKAS